MKTVRPESGKFRTINGFGSLSNYGTDLLQTVRRKEVRLRQPFSGYGIGMAGESAIPYILTKNMRPEPRPFAKSIKTKSR